MIVPPTSTDNSYVVFTITPMLINSVLLQRRIANKGGVRALSTSSVRLGENKNNAASPNQDDKTNPEIPEPKGQKTEDDNKVTQMAEQNVEPVVSRGNDGNTTQSQMVNKTEPPTETATKVKPDPAKSGKEGLLKLLGAMKVEVTNKRKLKNVKKKKSSESMSMSTPAAMESTISMFQQATAEASSKRWGALCQQTSDEVIHQVALPCTDL